MRSTPPLPPFRVNDSMPFSSRATASSPAAACSFATLAVRERIPTSFSTRVLVEAGLLMCYGADIVDTFRQVGVYTGSISRAGQARGPSGPAIDQFEFVINLQTAKSLGLNVPPTLLAQADEVIE